MSNIENIQKALDTALINFGATNNIKVALENIGTTTNISEPYLYGFLRPAETNSADLGFTDRRSGFYQININYESGGGTLPNNKMADLLNAAFAPGETLTRGDVCVKITRFSSEHITITSGWATTPVTVYWNTYTERVR